MLAGFDGAQPPLRTVEDRFFRLLATAAPLITILPVPLAQLPLAFAFNTPVALPLPLIARHADSCSTYGTWSRHTCFSHLEQDSIKDVWDRLPHHGLLQSVLATHAHAVDVAEASSTSLEPRRSRVHRRARRRRQSPPSSRTSGTPPLFAAAIAATRNPALFTFRNGASHASFSTAGRHPHPSLLRFVSISAPVMLMRSPALVLDVPREVVPRQEIVSVDSITIACTVVTDS
ncbi:hypothetical protein AURDEDRAFT_174052 [Auricularia subglabra TFB-10046 SS5]|nr:hypothetical protein AURDEDRAFT_174052 [Auricularia subglabra TFB-10046 SS5]